MAGQWIGAGRDRVEINGGAHRAARAVRAFKSLPAGNGAQCARPFLTSGTSPRGEELGAIRAGGSFDGPPLLGAGYSGWTGPGVTQAWAAKKSL